MDSVKIIVIVMALLAGAFAGCGNMKDDLLPSGSDKRPSVQEGTPGSLATGPAVGQYAPDFSVSDTLGNTITLSSTLTGTTSVVLYFTMWCPTCDAHMSFMQDNVIPGYPKVVFFAVDYVDGTVADAAGQQASNGFDGSGFVVLADTNQAIANAYNGTMGTTVVIDRNGIVQMNEDFKDGSKLESVLGGLQ
jgi:peroxiredoxin